MPGNTTSEWRAEGFTTPSVSVREVLGEVAWLRQVTPATLDRLAEHAVLHRIPTGSILFEQFEVPAFAKLLISGCVELVAADGTSETLLETVRPVDLLLPAAVLSQRPFLARARVVEETHLVLVHADAFRRAVSTDLSLCVAVLACQAAQFRRQVKLARSFRLRSAEERVGCYLLSLLQGQELNGPVRLPLEKRRIAGELGMTRETFSRTLAAMTRYGVSITGDRIEVFEADALQAHFRVDPLIDGPEPITPLTPGVT